MIRVGLVGLGFMGWIHWLTYQKARGARIVAVCERDERRLSGDWRDIKGNFGPPGEKVDLSKIDTYTELDDLLADPEIDLVDMPLPTSLHADAAIRALRAGKHVFCEKPMALALADCRRMVAAAEKADRKLFIGHVLPFFPEYDWARKEIASGKHGRLLGGAFRRVISDPLWMRNYWSPSHIGGPMLDLHVHDAHFIRLVFGMPESVTSQGRMRNNLPEFWHAQFRFPEDRYVVEATSGVVNQQGRPFDHGFEIHLEKATLAFQFAVIGGEGRYLCEPVLLDAKGKARKPKLADGDPMNAFAGELREVIDCVNKNRASEILGSELAQDAMRICEKEAASLERGKTVQFSSPRR